VDKWKAVTEVVTDSIACGLILVSTGSIRCWSLVTKVNFLTSHFKIPESVIVYITSWQHLFWNSQLTNKISM